MTPDTSPEAVERHIERLHDWEFRIHGKIGNTFNTEWLARMHAFIADEEAMLRALSARLGEAERRREMWKRRAHRVVRASNERIASQTRQLINATVERHVAKDVRTQRDEAVALLRDVAERKSGAYAAVQRWLAGQGVTYDAKEPR